MDVLGLGKDSCGQPITNGIHHSYHLIEVLEFQDGLIGSKNMVLCYQHAVLNNWENCKLNEEAPIAKSLTSSFKSGPSFNTRSLCSQGSCWIAENQSKVLVQLHSRKNHHTWVSFYQIQAESSARCNSHARIGTASLHHLSQLKFITVS